MIAAAIDLPSLVPDAVAAKLAEIAGLSTPTRPESVGFLVATLRYAAAQIPTGPGAWSWGEFHLAGSWPAQELAQADDPVPLAICASDLGLTDQLPRGAADTLRLALAIRLIEASDLLLQRLKTRLEAAGISTHGHHGLD